jgi:hypothetical protein
MSLDRFTNRDEILQKDGITAGITWKQSDINILQLSAQNVTLTDTLVVELHAYVRDVGDYIVGGSIQDFVFENDTIWIDHATAMSKFGIERGEFEVTVNVHEPILGNESNPLVFIKEISPDRRELQLKLIPTDDDSLDGIVDEYLDEYGAVEAFSLALNFGQNNIFKIINQRDWREPDDIVVRLYTPLPATINENDTAWIVEEMIDPFVDNISIFKEDPTITPTYLRGANFEIDPGYSTITETDFQSWNSLLGSNTSTSQQIIDRYFSGSLAGVDVGVDYSAFNNFVFYSSATERLNNFKYKLELIEYYSGSISTLQAASGSDSGSLSGNIATNQTRLDSVIGGFDAWERWLYYEPTASLSTHGVSGSILGAQGYTVTPWPKYLSNGSYVNHKVDSTIAQDWYTSLYDNAVIYDRESETALVKTIPEHIRNDENNSEYELFVNMIGHHFDIIYSYVDALTKTYKPEEHPKLGVGKETLYDVAESLGWKLANGKQASSLWQYALGVNTSGSYASTGSLFSKTDEEITTEVWRRIVNNLPYLLKTKGTERSIKALMNTYGIPQTLLSVREYGGPTVGDEAPTLIEDRFSYAVEFDGNSTISYVADFYSSSLFDHIPVANQVPPITRELRFKPATKQNMLLLTVTDPFNDGYNDSPDYIYSAIALQYTGSYSGSTDYGRIVYSHIDSDSSTDEPDVAYSNWLPLYNGDFWNLRWWYTSSLTNTALTAYWNASSNATTSYHIQVQNASDYINGNIAHSDYFSIHPADAPNFQYFGWGYNTISNRSASIDIGGRWSSDIDNDYYAVASGALAVMDLTTSDGIIQFSGSIQEYREWMEQLDQDAFDQHTLNPTSYIGALSVTSSYQTLVRHYPLGTDLNAIDLSTDGTIISSSHPNQNILDFSAPYGDLHNSNARVYGFSTPSNSERGNFVPIEETYYVKSISGGANTPRSQKIRLEDNYLIRQLSPTNIGERSAFDYAPVDTNRLGLFYSQADQINKDIFDQFAGESLDDYIGNPEDEFESSYPELRTLSKEYWKKFSDRNDINAYIRVFSQFDFTLFNQIKQLLPERVDDVMGLLIEPHALERSKVQITKRPTITTPQYDMLVDSVDPTATAEYILYTASIASAPNLAEAVTVYHVGDNGYADSGNYLMDLDRGIDPVNSSIYKHIYTLFPYNQDSVSAANLGLPGEITSSLHPLITSPTGSVIDTARSSNMFKLVTYHYSSSVAGDKYLRDKYKAVSQSIGLYYSRSLSDASYYDDEYQMTNNLRFNGSRITCPGINQNSTISALGFRPVIEVYETNPNQLIFNQDPVPQTRGGGSTSPVITPGNISVR